MKVHTTETQQQFKPVTLHIEIESQEEFEHLMVLFQRMFIRIVMESKNS